MSIIKDIRNIYQNIQKPIEPQVQPVSPVNQELMDKTVQSLNQQPQIAPNINRKKE